ncbi:MAG: glycosyltransferase family 10 [Patescibacteria group bacterium]|nr:glycosyltransferase family 10 [Patescibacteria group bacterium]
MVKRKKKIKIGFKWFWWYFDPQKNLFTKILKKDYDVEIDNKNPDYMFFSVFNHKSPSSRKNIGKIGNFVKKNSLGFYYLIKRLYYYKRQRWVMPEIQGDFVKIFFTGENARPNLKKCNWAFTFDYDEKLKHPRHFRLPLYYFGGFLKDVKNKKDISKIKKEKTKFCTFVFDNKVKFREDFFRALSRYKRIDAPGLSMRNMSPEKSNIKNTGDGEKGKYKNKLKFLKPYKFEIVFENASYPGYTTEKLIHSMAANCIPIYWGNPIVHKDFNTKSFINYADFEREVKRKIPWILFEIPIIEFFARRHLKKKTFKKIVKRIFEIDQNDELYESYLKEPLYKKEHEKYFDDKALRKRLQKIFN